MTAITDAHINPGLESLARQIEGLVPDPKNARTHGERNIKAIMESLLKYGQQKPIVVKDRVVMAGNGTLEAAKRLGWDRIACVDFHLEKRHAGAYALADNRTAELAEWNFPELSAQLSLFEQEGQLELGVMWTKEETTNLTSADFVTPQPETESANSEGPALEKIFVTLDQLSIINKAINKVRNLGGHPEWSDGVCLAVIAERSL